jgi:hypothetical protein
MSSLWELLNREYFYGLASTLDFVLWSKYRRTFTASVTIQDRSPQCEAVMHTKNSVSGEASTRSRAVGPAWMTGP